MGTTMRINGVLKMYSKIKYSLFLLPWCVLFLSFFVNFVISYFLSETLTSGGLATIYVYTFIMGIILLPQLFPFAIGLSMRRTDYLLGTLIVIVVMSVINALLLILFSSVEQDVTAGWGVGLYFFHLPYWSDGSILIQFWNAFSLLLHLFVAGFVIASIYYRFGKLGTLIFFICAFLLLSLGSVLATYNEWWKLLYDVLVKTTSFELTLWLFPLTIIYGLIAYGLHRRTTV